MPYDKTGLLWLRIEGRLSSYTEDALYTMPYYEWMALFWQVRNQEGMVGRYLWRIDQWKGKAEIRRLKKEHKQMLRRQEESQRRLEESQRRLEGSEDLCVADYADC